MVTVVMSRIFTVYILPPHIYSHIIGTIGVYRPLLYMSLQRSCTLSFTTHLTKKCVSLTSKLSYYYVGPWQSYNWWYLSGADTGLRKGGGGDR